MKQDRAFLVVAIGAVGLLSLALLAPFVQYIMTAVLLGYILYPLQVRLAPRVGPRVSAGLLILLSIFVIVLPFAVLLTVVVRQALNVVRGIREGSLDVTAVQNVVESLSGVELADLLQGRTEEQAASVLRNALEVFGGLTNVLIGFTILLFLLYYLLKDGDRFVEWLRTVTPFPSALQDELYAEADAVMWAVLVANVAVATIQGLLTGVGLAVVGFSNVAFWVVMTTFLSLLPLIGASIVWFPASVYLFVTGQALPAAFLFLYGTFVISLSDNYLRPLLSSRGANLNPGVLVLGIFGGLAAFGFVGLFFGPIVLGLFRALLDVFAREYH
ncbi:AI-2E family transporter [Halobacteriaceae archaeon GCM10025711]